MMSTAKNHRYRTKKLTDTKKKNKKCFETENKARMCCCGCKTVTAVGILPHFCESHELSSSVKIISVCCWTFPATVKD